MNWTIVFTVGRMTFREFWRTPEAVFWTYGFPVLMAVVLGFAFQPHAPAPVPVAVVRDQLSAESPVAGDPLRAWGGLVANKRLEIVVLDALAADTALARGRVALLVRGSIDDPVLRGDLARPESELARLLVEDSLREARLSRLVGDHVVNEPAERQLRVEPRFEAEERAGSRYIDFLIPGLLGLNLLGAGMWGVGFNLVQMRTQNLLRRLMVTPMRKGEFLFGYLLGRFVLMLPEAAAVVAFGTLVFGVPLRGSLLALLLLVIVGGMMFSGLGCLVASRAKTIEGVAGLMNLVQLPMWLLGGSFFNNDHLEGVVHWVAEAMPLTHLNRALRDCMLEANGIGAVAVPLAVLFAFGLLAFAVALKIFRWR
jgi:ABC-type multidrug transport system permease subunit